MVKNKQQEAIYKYIGDELRTAVVLAALFEIVDSGFGGVSLNQIAKRAKITPQRLNYHFQKIEQIVEILVQISFQTGRETLTEILLRDPTHSAEDVISRQIQSLFEWNRFYPEIVQFTLMLVNYHPKGKASSSYGEEIVVGYKRIVQSLEKLFPKMKPAELKKHALALHFMMIGGFSEFFRRQEGDDKAYCANMIEMAQGYIQMLKA